MNPENPRCIAHFNTGQQDPVQGNENRDLNQERQAPAQHRSKRIDIVLLVHGHDRFLLLRRIDGDGRILPPAKFALRLRSGIPGERLASAPGLRFARGMLDGQTVYYLRIDEGMGVGLDFRKTPAPWTRGPR